MPDNEAPEVPPAAESVGDTRTWHLSVAYDGTAFRGWQVQPGQRTVQGELRQRLRLLFRQPDLRIVGSSRTDAGVHALDQQVSFASVTPAELNAERLGQILNRWLPDDVRINTVQEQAPGFNARFDNCGKAYTYCLHIGAKPNPLFARFVWHVPRDLDLTAMKQVAKALEGEHDFASFAVNAKRDVGSTVRHISRIEVDRQGDVLCIRVVGESFLYKMVRSLVGYLVHTGLGRVPVEDVGRVLAACDRTAAADSAPAAGLFLMRVFFTPEEMLLYRETDVPFHAYA